MVILVLFTFSCELLSNPADPDYLDKLYEEIAWANAPRLNAVISAPGTWGNGSVKTKPENIRLGYNFEIEFNVMPGFSIIEWRAYKASDIENYRLFKLEDEGLDWNWLTDPNPFQTLKNADINFIPLLEWKEGEDKDIELRSPYLVTGGIFNFRININTNEQIIFIPLCNNAPGIRLTSPPMKEAGADLDNFSPTHTITVDLTSPVNDDTVRLEEGYIKIYAQDLLNGEPTGTVIDLTESGYFTARWNAGLWRIIIEPTLEGASYVENKMLTVVLGEKIKNIMGDSIAGINEQTQISFSWKTNRLISVDVTKLEASYNEANGIITVEWTLSASHSARISYTVNNSQRQVLESKTGAIETANITDVQSLFTGGVRNGQEVSNIQRYDIWLQLWDTADEIYRDSGFPVTIWNFDGMKVSRTNPVELIDTAGDFRPVSAGGKIVTDAAGANKSYVLTRNITIPTHMPISNFQGKLYGNGHTITINSISASSGNMGLFSEVSGTTANRNIIRDLTVKYATATNGVVQLNLSGASTFGGLSGTTVGDTQFLNTLVLGSANITHNTGVLTVGGMVGNMSNETTIANAFSGLNISCTAAGTSDVNFGGVVGVTATGGSAERRAINGITVTGNLTLNQTHSSTNGATYAGGAAGRTQASVTFHDIEFSGNLTITKGAGTTNSDIGGITGYVNNGNYSDCKVTGTISIPQMASTGTSHIGGLWGYYIVSGASYTAINSWMKGNITFHGDTAYVGGVAGYLVPPGSPDYLFITNCRYEGGSITVSGSGSKWAGGFTGRILGRAVLNNCYTLNGTISVITSGFTYVGGFSGTTNEVTISNCYSLIDVYAESSGGTLLAGGFASGFTINASTISNSYAAGNVSAISTGNTGSPYPFSVGGFIGHMHTVAAGSSITNCYATGAVTAEKRAGSGVVNAGGIAGHLAGRDLIESTVRNNFFSGTVTAIRNNTGVVNAGGIVGNITGTVTCTVSNNAAIGVSVTVLGGGTNDANRRAGRIWGTAETNPATGNGNYALITMLIEEDQSTSTFTPIIRPAVNGLTLRDGENAAASAFRNQNIWTTLGFSDLWDFSRISRGYPILRGLGGQ